MDDFDFELPAHPHDAYFKEVMSEPEMAADLFREHLPAEVVAAMDWRTLALVPGSFVKQSLQQAHSDLLFSVQADGAPCLLYILFEHQTTVDKRMPLRLLSYIVEIMTAQEEAHGLPLPPVLPLVLHQGPDQWTVSPCFEELFTLPPRLAEVLMPYLPKFRHALLDLSQFDPREQTGSQTLKAVLLLMKLVRQKRLREFLIWLRDQVMQLPQKLLRTSLLYGFVTEPIIDVEEIASTLENNHPLKENAVTLAEKLIARGEAKGEARGEARGQTRGRAIGKLTLMQSMLDLPVSSEEELAGVEVAELETRFRELERQYKEAFKGK